MTHYDPEVYWSRVGEEIEKRGKNLIAGDDIPYYIYQREKVLKKFIDTLSFDNQVILEIGFGPGGNLKYIIQNHPFKKLLGVDISETMLGIAKSNLEEYSDKVELYKINGSALPFEEKSVDLTYSITVLHHITDEKMIRDLIAEMCRVTKNKIILIENIGLTDQIGGEGSFISRKLNVYEALFSDHHFKLSEYQYLNTRVSRNWYWLLYFGLYKKIFNQKHKEGEPIGGFIKALMSIVLPFSKILDNVFKDKKSIARIIFIPE